MEDPSEHIATTKRNILCYIKKSMGLLDFYCGYTNWKQLQLQKWQQFQFSKIISFYLFHFKWFGCCFCYFRYYFFSLSPSLSFSKHESLCGQVNSLNFFECFIVFFSFKMIVFFSFICFFSKSLLSILYSQPKRSCCCYCCNNIN